MTSLDDAFEAYEQGDRDKAAKLAGELKATDADARNLLAVIALDRGAFEEAETLAQDALRDDENNPVYLNTLGNAMVEQGRSGDAIAVFDRALRASDNQPDILFNRGNAQRQAGLFEDAIESFRSAVRARPGYIAAYNNLAVTLRLNGDAESAATVLIEALAHAPDQPELRFNLGNSLHAAGRTDAAVAAFAKAHAFAPERADILVNWGVALAELGQKDVAEQKFRQAIDLAPDLAPAYVGLADLADDGTRDGVAHRRAVLALKPDLAAIRSSLLMCLHYASGISRDEILEEHLAFGRLFNRTDPPAWNTGPARNFDPDRRLKVGFISGDFRFHAMLFFALPVIAGAPAEHFEVFCYSTTVRPDQETVRFRNAADVWRDVQTLSDEALAALIVRDEIDILIDLSGHAPRNRLLTFARRPAPILVAWGDYVDTRGLDDFDILIGDDIHTPADEQAYFCETLVQMPVDYICYQPPGGAPDPAPEPPCVKNGFVTFGSFSEITKVQPETISLWADVLKAVPESKFFMNNYLLEDEAKAGRLISQFMECGIPSERISIGSGGSHHAFLSQYKDVDIILDTLPYSGGLTTCEALWMGVPVIALHGDRFCARHAAAHLSAARLTDLVASSKKDYAGKAKMLAADHARLCELRGTLRQQVASSPLTDTAEFCRGFYDRLRQVWWTVSASQGNPEG